MDDVLKDARFAHIARDPKFRRIPRAERKVKIDKRFQSMFKDKKFQVKYTVDKRGRPVNQTSAENLRKYYDLSSSEEESDSDEQTSKETEEVGKDDEKQNKKGKKTQPKNESDESSSDNCISSNGELLRVKPQESDEDSEEESESNHDSDNAVDGDDLKADLKESKNQLKFREKNETTKIAEKVKEKLKDLSVNYARGEGFLLTDSSSDEESSEASDEEEEIDHNWGELDKEAETTDEVTHRLAVCNMDWDRIRATDLMVLFHSFLPSGGLIRSVTIYPSDFGLQRMKEEEITGPTELTQSKREEEGSDEEDNEEGSQYHMEKLRQYQLNRLKYYYAVVEFDSPETANKVYTECDGTEYESTATKLDLRFIPDDMKFDQTAKEVCNEMPELSKYQPRQFTTTALQQVKVELTWDETNPERQEIAQKLNSGKLDEITESDLQGYLASETSDDDDDDAKEVKRQETKADSSEEDADPIEKYKSLLKEIEEQEEAKQKKDVELEFTWGIGEKEKAEKLVQEKMKKDEYLTPFEQYLEKRKAKKKAKREERNKLKNDSEDSDASDVEANEKKQKSVESDASDSSRDDDDEEKRKAELELLLMDENDGDNKRHFNMKKIEENASMSKSKQKRLSKKKKTEDDSKADDFEVDVKDSRFDALFTSHHFNIDPADPHYRKTKGTEALIGEKLKRRANTDTTEKVQAKQPKRDQKLNAELQTLVKSVKKKTQNVLRPIK